MGTAAVRHTMQPSHPLLAASPACRRARFRDRKQRSPLLLCLLHHNLLCLGEAVVALAVAVVVVATWEA